MSGRPHQFLAAIVLTFATPACAAPPDKQPKSASSFFEPFNRIDTGRWYISDGWSNGAHQGCTWKRDSLAASGGILRLILQRDPKGLPGLHCGEIRTNQALGYGTYEVRMRTAPGSGTNTAIFTYSGPPLTKVHDEIDFEFLGKKTSQVQLNHYVSARGGHERVIDLGFDASARFNDYAFQWLPGSAKWYVNGKLVREEAGENLPKVPGQFFLSLWVGSPSSDAWLGHFNSASGPIWAEVDWAAFTRPGERCKFPQSITCT